MTLDCDNCGAPKQYDSYVDVHRCEHCGTVHLPTARALGDVRILDATSAVACPLGHGALHQAEADRWEVLQCPSCLGVFTDGLTFWKIVEYRRERDESKRATRRKLKLADLERRLDCPRCEHAMSAHPYYGPGDFVIDTCTACSHVWLDPGEIREAVQADWTPHL